MNYGLPYKGSKNRLAQKIINTLPKATNFYDLFGGGFSITHCALLNNKWQNLHANEIDKSMCDLFNNAIQGKYKDETQWISREDFFRLKDSNPYVKICWSFGNGKKDYLYAREIEPYKKALHYAIVFDDFSLFEKLCPETAEVTKEALQGITDIKERRLRFGPAIIKELKRLNNWDIVQNNKLYKSAHWRGGGLNGKNNDLQSPQSPQSLQRLQRLQNLENLQRLQNLERLERLESLERLERLEITSLSYEQVKIKKDSVIYCDIPYKNTSGYDLDFDHNAFYEWCKKQDELVVISEYVMPKDDFVQVACFNHRAILSRDANNKVEEKLFVPKHQIELWQRMAGQEQNTKPKKWKQLSLFDSVELERCQKAV